MAQEPVFQPDCDIRSILPIPDTDWLSDSFVPDTTPIFGCADFPIAPIPSSPACPTIESSTSDTEIELVPSPQAGLKLEVFSGLDCSFDIRLTGGLPCPVLNEPDPINAGPKFTMVQAPQRRFEMTIEVLDDCTFDFDIDIRSPCPVITAPQSMVMPQFVDVPQQRVWIAVVKNYTDCSFSFEADVKFPCPLVRAKPPTVPAPAPPFAGMNFVDAGEQNGEVVVDRTLATCSSDLSLEIDFPCPRIPSTEIEPLFYDLVLPDDRYAQIITTRDLTTCEFTQEIYIGFPEAVVAGVYDGFIEIVDYGDEYVTLTITEGAGGVLDFLVSVGVPDMCVQFLGDPVTGVSHHIEWFNEPGASFGNLLFTKTDEPCVYTTESNINLKCPAIEFSEFDIVIGAASVTGGTIEGTGSVVDGRCTTTLDVDLIFGDDLKTWAKEAVVPLGASYAAVACMESTKVWFFEVTELEFPALGTRLTARIDPRYVEICEPGSLKILSAFPDRPTMVGGVIKEDGTIHLSQNSPLQSLPVRVNLLVAGLRKGFKDWHLPRRSEDEFKRTAQFWNGFHSETTPPTHLSSSAR